MPAELLRFQRREPSPILGELSQADDDIVCSLPELFAAVHRLEPPVDVRGERFVMCSCGFVQRFHGDDVPSMCSLHASVEIFRAELLCRYGQMVARTLAAGSRDEREYAALARGI